MQLVVRQPQGEEVRQLITNNVVITNNLKKNTHYSPKHELLFADLREVTGAGVL